MRLIKLITVISFFYSLNLLAYNTDIEVRPNNPVKGESFQVIFKIQLDSNVRPEVSFKHSGAELSGKSNMGMSSSVTIINGNIQRTIVSNVAYEFIAVDEGTFKLSHINIRVGGKIFREKDLILKILTEGSGPRKFFVKAHVSKDTVYLGEGIDIDYYLYSTISIEDSEIAAFPKLNNFIKRFHRPNERTEVVKYDGMMYKRSKKYTARVYPEKVGFLELDPLKLKVQYSSAPKNNRFGNFGFSLGQYIVSAISSKIEKIKVLPLPSKEKPPHFTGLIGEHKFSLNIQRHKYLVNEAIELKLTVEGPGALENLDAPKLLEHDNLETFETKGEMSEVGHSHGKKVFEYTYLARGPLSFPSRDFKLAYFDPHEKKFKTKIIKMPEIIVTGAQISAARSEVKSVASTKDPIEMDENKKLAIKKESIGLLAPDFDPGPILLFWPKLINIFLTAGIFVVLISLFLRREIKDKKDKEIIKLCKKIKNVGAHYSLAFKLIQNLGLSDKDGGLIKIIEKSSLSKEGKEYFFDFINLSEGSSFGHDNDGQKFVYNSKFFKELQALIKVNNKKSSKV